MKISTQVKVLLAALAMTTLFVSCKKEVKEDPFGILTMSLTMPNGQAVECAVDQEKFTIDNSKEPVEPGMPAAMYLMKVTYTATLNTVVAYDGKDVVSGTTEIDFSKPVKLTATKDGKVNTYTVTLVEDKNDASETTGKKVNADMTKAGFPACAWFDVIKFNDAFFAVTSTYPDGTADANPAYYNVYKSVDGISWAKVSTTPKVVGAYGARLVSFKDKLFVYGGGRYYGTDEDGNAPEKTWGMYLNITKWFVYSTTDGTTWKEETVEGLPTGYVDPKFVVSGDKLLYFGGMGCTFGQLQNGCTRGVAVSTDGLTWTYEPLTDDTTMAATYSKLNGVVYAFKGKVYSAGGFKNYIGAEGFAQPGIYSTSDNGATWTLETENGGFGDLWGMRVVGTDDVLYMVGGEYLGGEDGKTQVVSNKIYRSTDGKTWTEITGESAMPEAYAGRMRAGVVADGDMMWIFGGFKGSEGYYGGPAPSKEMVYDTWKKRIK